LRQLRDGVTIDLKASDTKAIELKLIQLKNIFLGGGRRGRLAPPVRVTA
jgi:hypothetical protein